MRICLLLCILLFAFRTVGQITITDADMPVVGDTLEYATAFITTFDGADTGPNHYWDFSALGDLVNGADTVVSVGSTPLLYQFFFNNPFLFPANDADHSFRGADLDFQAVTVTDLYDYYATDPSDYRNVGFGANINGLPSSIQRSPTDHIYEFPLSYGNTSTSNSAFEITVPTIAFVRQEQARTNEVDGWGMLTLPSGNYSTLRVKSTLDRVDSIYINALSFGFTIPEPQTVEYKWLTQGEHRPVLQITTVGGFVAGVQYKPGTIVTGGVAPTVDATFTLYPNPVIDELRVETGSVYPSELQLLGMDGRLLRSLFVRDMEVLDVNDLRPGNYFIRLGGVVKRFAKIK